MHGHRHSDGKDPSRPGRRRLAASIALNLLITVAEVVGGIISGSLALLSDALHNFTDTVSQIISYVAQSVSRRDATERNTFGYARFEVVAAFFNLVTLFIIALFLAKEGVERLIDPDPIRGGVMLVVAIAGLLANVASALLLRRDARHSLNIRSAYLHIVTDAVSSVAVVAGALIVITLGFQRIDPILTILISAYIMYHGYDMLKTTTRILMNSTPPGLDLEEVVRVIRETPGVLGAHHVHVWLMDENSAALEAHVVIESIDFEGLERTKASIKHRLVEQFSIQHSTLEFEHEGILDTANCEDVHTDSAR